MNDSDVVESPPKKKLKQSVIKLPGTPVRGESITKTDLSNINDNEKVKTLCLPIAATYIKSVLKENEKENGQTAESLDDSAIAATKLDAESEGSKSPTGTPKNSAGKKRTRDQIQQDKVKKDAEKAEKKRKEQEAKAEVAKVKAEKVKADKEKAKAEKNEKWKAQKAEWAAIRAKKDEEKQMFAIVAMFNANLLMLFYSGKRTAQKKRKKNERRRKNRIRKSGTNKKRK